MPGLVLPHSRFLHVPKTGGNWVAAVLSELFPAAQRMPKIHTTRKSAPRPDLPTFAFVRHPLTWYQSYFSYKCRKGWDPRNEWDDRVRSESFAGFVEAALTETPAYYSRLLRRYVGRSGDEIDFIGKFEFLVDDLIQALELAGEQFDADQIRSTPPVNQSDYTQHPTVYTEALRRHVLNVESEAIQRFYADDAGNSP